MNYRRGLFRLWLLLAVAWLAVVAFAYGRSVYQEFEQAALKAAIEKDPIVLQPAERESWLRDGQAWKPAPWAALMRALAFAALPPGAVLALGAALNWALSGFRRDL